MSCLVNLSLKDSLSSGLSSFLLVLQVSILFRSIVLLLGRVLGFSLLLLKHLLVSRGSFGKFHLKQFLLSEGFSLAVEVSGVEFLEDGVVLLNEFVLLFHLLHIETGIGVVQDDSLVSLSLSFSLLFFESSFSCLPNFKQFFGSEVVALVDLFGKLVTIDLVSSLLLSLSDLEDKLLFGFLSLSSSAESVLKVDFLLKFFHLEFFQFFLSLLLSFLKLLSNSFSVNLLSLSSN